MNFEDPWAWMQPYDARRFGEVILDKTEQERWCRAVLLGGLPFMWRKAEAARNQVSEETLRLQRAVVQMQAARDVAQLEYEIAGKNLTAVQTRIDAGTATLHDLDDARAQASERFYALQDVTFELERSQLGVLRSTGELEKWALGTQ